MTRPPPQIARNQIDLMPIAFKCQWGHLPEHLAIGLKAVRTLTDSHILATGCIVKLLLVYEQLCSHLGLVVNDFARLRPIP